MFTQDGRMLLIVLGRMAVTVQYVVDLFHYMTYNMYISMHVLSLVSIDYFFFQLLAGFFMLSPMLIVVEWIQSEVLALGSQDAVVSTVDVPTQKAFSTARHLPTCNHKYISRLHQTVHFWM